MKTFAETMDVRAPSLSHAVRCLRPQGQLQAISCITHHFLVTVLAFWLGSLAGTWQLVHTSCLLLPFESINAIRLNHPHTLAD